MERLFQDDHGVVDELAGTRLAAADAVVASFDRNVLVLWLEDGERSCWYRVFIDGIYCGIDRSPRCGIHQDLDDELEVVDHSAFFSGRQLRRARVSTDGEGDGAVIELRLELDSGASATLAYFAGAGHCSLTITSK